MKKTAWMFVGLTVFAATLVTNEVLAAESNSYISNGTVDFIPNTDPTNPVNPENPDPENPVKPIDPTDPDGPNPGTNGPLSIDFASSLDFGVNKISNKNEIYYARAQKFLKDDGTVSPLQTANYIQVTDNRGNNAGWSLSVRQNGQFQNQTTLNKELTGSVITLKDPKVASNAIGVTPPVAKSTITLDAAGAESVVMTAAKQTGAGTWVNAWGNVESVTELDKDANEVQADITKSVTLSVPGSTPKDAVSYTTTLTWVLSDTPGIDEKGV